MQIIIIIIEDNKGLEEDTFVWELKDKYGNENVFFISDPKVGILKIKENLNKNIIVFLDIDFPPNELNGHQVLDEINKISNLIPVILWSGIDENKETFSDFINNNAFGFISKTATSEEAFKIVNKAIQYLKTSIDNTIEEWIMKKEEDKDKPVYFTGNGKSYSLNDILYEIRQQSMVGKSFSKKLNKLTIDLLLRKKENLDD